MKNTNKFLIAVGIIIVVAIIVLVYMIILDVTGKINQGNFRINDLVVKSSIEVSDSELTSDSDLSDMPLSISQMNDISILIAKNDENVQIERIYIDNISINYPNKKGDMTIFQLSQESKYNLSSNIEKIDLTPKEENSQYLVELRLENSKMLSNITLPEGVETITYDGTILNTIGIKIKDIEYSIKFDLNIVDKYGKTNKCNISLKIPKENLITEGISIERQDLSNFNFRVK